MERDFVEEFKVPTKFPDDFRPNEEEEEEEDPFPLFLLHTEPRGGGGNDSLQWWSNDSGGLLLPYPGSPHRPIPNELLRTTVNHVIVPVVCFVGILGNAFNFYVFYRRWYQKFMNDAEKSVTVGLMSLSVSDAAFCLAAVPGIFLLYPPTAAAVHSVASLHYAVYRPFFSNLFLLNSTWLIVTVSVQRLVAVTWSARGRACVAADPRKTVAVHAAIFAAALAVCLPLLMRNTVARTPCGGGGGPRVCYHVRPSETLTSPPFVVAYQALWTVLGTLLPLAVLVFCNARLIAILCRARYSAALVAADRSNRAQVTALVVATVASFVVLVCPSMAVECFGWIAKGPWSRPPQGDGQGFLAAVTLTNLLQAVKFSFNFLLYCTVSRKFRRELKACSRVNDSCRPNRVDLEARVRFGYKR